VIQTFERADVETDPARKRALLTFVIVGGGLVGVELMGELTTFVFAVSDLYRHVSRDEIRFELIEGAPHLVPELDADLGDYAARVLEKRGVRVRLKTFVKAIRPNGITLPDGEGSASPGEEVDARTVVIATGVAPNP